MEIITLVKAGIRNRKGIFLGFLILTILIVVSNMTMFGVNSNYQRAIDRAYEIEDNGAIYTFFRYGNYTDELNAKVEASRFVESIERYDCLIGDHAECNAVSDGNSFMVMKYQEIIPIFNTGFTGFINYTDGNSENTELKDNSSGEYSLKEGEIYIPYGLKSKFKAKIGDTIKLDFLSGKKYFTIKGFVQEPYMGTSVMGYKTVFISDEDFDEIYADCISKIESANDYWALGDVVYIHPTDQQDESTDILLRNLNRETKVDDMSWASVTRETSEHYTGLFIEIIMAVVTGFSGLLFVIFLVITGHNISTEIENDYTNLGILKSQGMRSITFRIVYLAEYLMVEALGVIVGFVIAIPVERWMSRVFFNITGILPMSESPAFYGLMLMAVLFILTGIFIYLFTGKITKVTPVKAINGSKEDYYFDNRLNLPITKRGLSASLGLRQITSAPKRYISIILVTSLLIFMIIVTGLMSEYIRSRDALASMGVPFCEIEFSFKNRNSGCTVRDIEKIVEEYAGIRQRLYKTHLYLSINGERVMTEVKAYPDEFSSTYRGRDVKFDNEIVVTGQVAKLLDIDIGDTVTIGREDISKEFIVVGIFQTMNDTGKAISMSLDGLSRLTNNDIKYKVDDLYMFNIEVKDDSRAGEVVNILRDKYGDDIEVEYNEYAELVGNVTEAFYLAANGSGLMIYILTFIFGLVTVMMVCAKAFIQERADIGIMRASGFTVNRIRIEYACRFGIISCLSAVFGCIMSVLFAEPLMSSIFSMFGIPHVDLEFTATGFIIPVLAAALIYMLFGFLASRRVKKVSERELITE